MKVAFLEKSHKLEYVKEIVDANWAQFATNDQLLDGAQQVYESIGDVQDAWVTLCPETEVERDTCDLQRRKNHADAITDSVADLETNGNKCNIPYTVTVQNNYKEEMLPI